MMIYCIYYCIIYNSYDCFVKEHLNESFVREYKHVLIEKLRGLLYSLHLELETSGIDLIMDNFSRNMY